MNGMIRLIGADLKLVQVQSFFRHGARTPLHYVISPIADTPWTKKETNDVPETMIPCKHVDLETSVEINEDTMDLIYKPFKLPGGEIIGMLTSIGQKDLFEKGKRLRKEYAGVIVSDPPKISEIGVRSTRVGRNVKSVRCLMAGLLGATIEEPLEIPSIPFETEVLFPNPKNCGVMDQVFLEGSEELKNMQSILECKEKLKKALGVDVLLDELNTPIEKTDCRVYYVRDDYIARKHNNFTIPPELEDLFDEMSICSATELLNELLGKQSNWKSNIDITIGPVLHIILSNMHKHSAIPPMQLYAVHDSTLLPMLIALDCFDGHWPDFAADISFELYSQISGPSPRDILGNEELPKSHECISEYPDSTIPWSEQMMKNFWVRVKYANKPMPLAQYWGLDRKLMPITGSNEFVPFCLLAKKWSNLALLPNDYVVQCKKVVGRVNKTLNGLRLGPKNI